MSQGYLKRYPRCSSMSLHTVPSELCSAFLFHAHSMSFVLTKYFQHLMRSLGTGLTALNRAPRTRDVPLIG